MKNRLGLIISGCLFLVILLLVTGCHADNPTSPVTTDIRITVLPCTDDSEGNIRFEDVTITKGTLDEDYMVVRTIAIPHESGDPCFLISGKIKNNSSTRYWVAHHAYGYDEDGNEVAFTLDAGPIVGIAQVGIEPNETENFSLHLSWSENATSFKVFSQKSANMFP